MPTQPRPFAESAAASDVPAPDADHEWSDADLGPAWYVVALQRWLLPIFLVAVVCGLIAFWNASRQPLRYEGVTTLLVVPPAQGGAQVNPATFRAIVENQSLASEVIDELKLPDITPHRFLASALAVDEIRGTNIVKVRITLGDPQLAAEASRRLAQKAILLAQRITQQDGASVQEQLKRYLSEATQRLQQADRELVQYKQRAQIDLVQEDTLAQLKQRSDLLQLVVDIEKERARLAAAQTEIARQQPLLKSPRTPAAEDALQRIPTAERSAVENKAGERTAADAQQLDLTNPYVNPVYQTLDFQIATSRTRIAALEKERDQLVNVKKIGGKELAQLSELYRRQAEQDRLQANYDLAAKVHEDLALRYEQSRTLPVGNTSQLQVVDQALPPDVPLGRKRVQKAMLGAGMGFIGMSLIALMWESRSRMR